MIEKSPFDLTLDDWQKMSLTERRAARMAAHSLGYQTLQREFVSGKNYVLLCQFSDTARMTSERTPMDVSEVVELAAKSDAVPFEFFSSANNQDVQLRFAKLNTVLSRAKAYPKSGTEGAD